MTIAARIAQVRRERNLSQEAFGSALGVSRQSISKWESGASLPETEKLVAICRIYDVRMDWLLCMDGAPAEPDHAMPPPPEPVFPLENSPVATPEPKKRRTNSRRSWLGALYGALVMAVLTGALLLTGVLCIGAPRLEGPGFDSPEAAVQNYLDALKASDAEAMLSTFAQETFVDHFDFSAFVTRINSYSPDLMQRLPADGGFASVLNLAQRRGELARQLYWQYLTLTQPASTILTGDIVPFDSTGQIDQFVKSLSDPGNLERLNTLELVEFVDPATLSVVYVTDANQTNIRKQAMCYGADELRPMAARIMVSRKPHLLFLDTARYGTKWYNVTPGGNLAALMGASVYSGGVLLES